MNCKQILSLYFITLYLTLNLFFNDYASMIILPKKTPTFSSEGGTTARVSCDQFYRFMK